MTKQNEFQKSSLLADYLIVFFIMLWTGGAATYGFFSQWGIVLLPIVLFVCILQRIRVTGKSLIFPLFLIIFLFIQKVIWNGNLNLTVDYATRYMTIYLMAYYLIKRGTFVYVFLRITYVLAFISIVFWAIDLFGGHNYLMSVSNAVPQLGWENLQNNDLNSAFGRTLWFYQVRDDVVSVPHNSGPFWEHGIFAIYLVIALYIKYVNTAKLKDFVGATLLVALISTFSTTGYIAMSMLFLSFVFARYGRSFTSVLFTIALVVGFYYLMQLDFMGDKIYDNMQNDNTQSRFAAMAYHWTQIEKSPIFGYGPFLTTVLSDLMMSPNGWTNLLRIWGIPMSIYFVYLTFQCGKEFLNENSVKIAYVFFTIIVFVVVFSQTLSSGPFYLFLYFTGAIHLSNN